MTDELEAAQTIAWPIQVEYVDSEASKVRTVTTVTHVMSTVGVHEQCDGRA